MRFRDFLRQQDEQWKEVVEAAGYDRGLTGNNDPGPLALPAVLGIALFCAACGEGVLRGARRRASGGPVPVVAAGVDETEGESPQGKAPVRQLVGTVAVLFLYGAAVQILGFPLSTLLFVSGASWWLGARWWSALLCAALMVIVVRLLFVNGFEVQLPGGLLGLPV